MPSMLSLMELDGDQPKEVNSNEIKRSYAHSYPEIPLDKVAGLMTSDDGFIQRSPHHGRDLGVRYLPLEDRRLRGDRFVDGSRVNNGHLENIFDKVRKLLQKDIHSVISQIAIQ